MLVKGASGLPEENLGSDDHIIVIHQITFSRKLLINLGCGIYVYHNSVMSLVSIPYCMYLLPKQLYVNWRAHQKWKTLGKLNRWKECHPWASCQIRKIAGAHAPGMPGTFSPSPQVSDPDMHHGTCVTHVPWCMPGSLTSGFIWNRRRGETFPAFPAHAQPAILRIW